MLVIVRNTLKPFDNTCVKKTRTIESLETVNEQKTM